MSYTSARKLPRKSDLAVRRGARVPVAGGVLGFQNMQRSFSGLLVAALTWSLLGCADCERQGCDALGERAAAAGAGLGGVIAQRSDVVQDGCQECPLGGAAIAVWRLDAPVTTEAEAMAVVGARAPDVEQEASGRYHVALDPAAYLVCVRPSCVVLDVGANQTETVNIERLDGPTRFHVSRPNLDGLQEESGLDIGF
jgi:hypothetical protein